MRSQPGRSGGHFCHYGVGGENKTARDVEGKQSREKLPHLFLERVYGLASVVFFFFFLTTVYESPF